MVVPLGLTRWLTGLIAAIVLVWFWFVAATPPSMHQLPPPPPGLPIGRLGQEAVPAFNYNYPSLADKCQVYFSNRDSRAVAGIVVVVSFTDEPAGAAVAASGSITTSFSTYIQAALDYHE